MIAFSRIKAVFSRPTPAQHRAKVRASLRPGVQINTYTLTNKLGSGGFGDVWEAARPGQNNLFAIKIGEKPSAAERRMKKLTGQAKPLQIRLPDQAIREVQRPHPNIVGHHEVGSHKAPGVPKSDFKVMEKLEGTTLEDLMHRPDWGESELMVFTVMRKALLGLKFLHDQGIVHNDIKEGNITVTDDWDVVLFDLGNAEKFPSKSRYGTEVYMPLERRMYNIAKPSSDLFSLGVVFYQMLTLRHPYDSVDRKFNKAEEAVVLENMKYGRLDQEINTFPLLLQRLLKGMLAINPRERFQSADEVIDLINDIIIELL